MKIKNIDSDELTIGMPKETIEEIESLLNDIAHIGVDFGYGEMEFNNDNIQKARDLLDKIGARKYENRKY